MDIQIRQHTHTYIYIKLQRYCSSAYIVKVLTNIMYLLFHDYGSEYFNFQMIVFKTYH